MVIRFLFTIAISLLPLALQAQKEKKVVVEYEYYPPNSQTIEEAKLTALDRAKIKAIEEEFGSFVTQNNTTLVSNISEESNIEFLSVGSSQIKGEWVETIGDPVYNIAYADNQLVVKVKLKGRIRELVSNNVDFEVQVLCNGLTPQHARTDFRNGDTMYVSLRSPVDGYVSLYLIDYNTNSAICMVPYLNSNGMAKAITKDKTYYLFSPQDDGYFADEYIMTCSEGQERNDIYVIFSTNTFSQSNVNIDDNSGLRELRWKDFQKWLANLRKKDSELQVKQFVITIKS